LTKIEQVVVEIAAVEANGAAVRSRSISQQSETRVAIEVSGNGDIYDPTRPDEDEDLLNGHNGDTIITDYQSDVEED
jgi:hypothetical protein